jgi:hypothetical protein
VLGGALMIGGRSFDPALKPRLTDPRRRARGGDPIPRPVRSRVVSLPPTSSPPAIRVLI